MTEDAEGDLLGAQLINAASLGYVLQVGALLDQGVDIETRKEVDRRIGSALHFSSDKGHGEVVAFLLDRRANIEALSSIGGTPIMCASTNGHLAIVKMLHARGANIHHANVRGENALMLAAWKDHMPVCEFLVSKGAELITTTTSGESALSHYGKSAAPKLTAEVKALRCTDLRAAFEIHRRGRDAVHRASSTLLFSDDFSDLVFVCPGGERIHAHRNIVSASSPHARVLLQGPWAENKDERVAVVQMPQSAAAVGTLLRFMYTGETDAAAMEASMSGVLELASQHEQPVLKAACERHAIATISAPTVVPLLLMADLHDLAMVKAACVGFIRSSGTNATAVTMSSPYMDLKTTRPLLWRELRAALGLPEEEKEEEEEGAEEEEEHKEGEGEGEGRGKKRPRQEN